MNTQTSFILITSLLATGKDLSLRRFIGRPSTTFGPPLCAPRPLGIISCCFTALRLWVPLNYKCNLAFPYVGEQLRGSMANNKHLILEA